MSDSRRSIWNKVSLLMVGLALPLASQGADFSFESHAVSAEGLAVDSQVAWLWVGRAVEGPMTRVEAGSREGWVDRGGTAWLEHERALPEQSIWALVDLATGEARVGRPDSSRAALQDLELAISVAGEPILPGRRYEVLLVRPRTGAWGGFVMDGGAVDADGRSNASVTLDLGQLEGLGRTTKGAGGLAAGDRLLLADPDRLVLWVATITTDAVSELPTSNASR